MSLQVKVLRLIQELEARFTRDVLAGNSWNRTATARELGIHKTTLHRKVRRLTSDPWRGLL